ncbi:DUF3306 domain-containing protein [Grimontia hollisae]|uniref:Protein of uncharacterized function (DUF3306) n=1 Tax=Grimontia hollisae TaxID=673 RepID=A0A377HLQ9_GRIHO|nr:DUF3306 domain-containing protein [Grimontia hollisae]STO57024.1 Protein of uncharacterised function (DUF3306) [Grimontia hollisae]
MVTDSFLHRWSRRKQGLASSEEEKPIDVACAGDNEDITCAETQPESDETDVPLLSMEDVDRLKEGDSAAVFLAKGVSSQIKKAALRKLFHSDTYNALDGMNEYDLDYSKPTKLTVEVVESLRKWTREQIEESFEQSEQSEQIEETTQHTQAPVDASSDSETKSPHDESGDNLSYRVEQNVPLEDEGKSSNGS